MLMYALIGICLVLTGIAGLQFTYIYWVDRLYGERRKYNRELERKCSRLASRLETAERRLSERNNLFETVSLNLGVEDESWADLIEDR